MEQLIAHAFGDYVLQSNWMAQHKRQRWGVALVHALAYTVAFLPLTQSPAALAVIASAHAVIDRLGLARYVVFAKNFLAPPSAWPKWSETNATGYDASAPPWLTTWLFIIADNAMHLAVNYAALRWL